MTILSYAGFPSITLSIAPTQSGLVKLKWYPDDSQPTIKASMDMTFTDGRVEKRNSIPITDMLAWIATNTVGVKIDGGDPAA